MEALVIFLVIFISFFFVIRQLLSHTRDTIGANSPFVVARTYKPTFSITRIVDVFGVIMYLVVGSIFIKLASPLINDSEMLAIGVGIFGIIVSLLIVYAGLVQGVILYNHWQNDQKYTLTLLPEGRKVTLEDQQITFSTDELASVKLVTNAHHRLLKSYYQYTLTNGYSFAISIQHPVAAQLNDFLNVKRLMVYETYFPLVEGGVKWPFLETIYGVYARIFKRNIVAKEMEV